MQLSVLQSHKHRKFYWNFTNLYVWLLLWLLSFNHKLFLIHFRISSPEDSYTPELNNFLLNSATFYKCCISV